MIENWPAGPLVSSIATSSCWIPLVPKLYLTCCSYLRRHSPRAGWASTTNYYLQPYLDASIAYIYIIGDGAPSAISLVGGFLVPPTTWESVFRSYRIKHHLCVNQTLPFKYKQMTHSKAWRWFQRYPHYPSRRDRNRPSTFCQVPRFAPSCWRNA